MAIVGLNFTKMMIEKKLPVTGKVSISNNVTIKDVKEAKLAIGGDQKAMKFTFQYTSKYEPGIGNIELNGELVLLSDEKTAKEVLDSWKKNKSIPKEATNQVMNNVLNKCNIQALILSKDLGLPAPIPLPKLKQQ
jgi:hypothetical protein